MFQEAALQQQLDGIPAGECRVLIVGAGVAGATLAALLRGRGHHPVLVERSRPAAAAGYMLGLLPLVDPVIRALGIEEDYVNASVGMHEYRMRGSGGTVLKDYSLDSAIGRYGHYRGIERSRLLELLSGREAPVTFGTTVDAFDQVDTGVRIRFASRAADAEFDAVVAADGLDSGIRRLIWDVAEVQGIDTGWGGWVSWVPPDADPGRYEELWGKGSFVGTYPVKGRMGVFVGGPNAATGVGRGAFVDRVRSTLSMPGGRVEAALAAVAGDPHPYYWRFADVRAARWCAGRVALLGDAAAGFLPTAGVGAAMAMESASVLADRLSTATPGSIPAALSDYEQTQRPRVEAAQDNSRSLARLMFRENAIVVRSRDLLARFFSVESALRPIVRLLSERDPRAT